MYQVYGGWEEEVAITAGVGEDSRRFSGYKRLLTEHSGYIKSQLEAGHKEVSVPSISPEIFALILNFINTGYLDLNEENIYSVLLATHLLHMPRAVEICRSYLVGRNINETSTTIVKPIPSRKYFPIYWPPPAPFFPSPIPYVTYPILEPPVHSIPSTSFPQTKINIRPKPKETMKDIACCDGPVRFKRVLNTNYALLAEKANSTSKNYVCSFCKHTFKSHYCYRKHTRRHLNPVLLESTSTEAETTLKDMNVQYYPCKTCGSKFPSYYFVHKHRKLCHKKESIEKECEKTSEENTIFAGNKT